MSAPATRVVLTCTRCGSPNCNATGTVTKAELTFACGNCGSTAALTVTGALVVRERLELATPMPRLDTGTVRERGA